MASKKLRGVLLCEDKEHRRLFEKLVERWFGTRNFRVEIIPNTQGAGDAYVISRFPSEVQLARKKESENYALVVAIDGDRAKLNRRLSQLDQALAEAGLPARGKNERIAIFVPTRNVETWELWLCGHRDIDEETDFKQRFRDAERRGEISPKLAVKSWFRQLSDEERRQEEETLPALVAGRLEVRRLDSA